MNKGSCMMKTWGNHIPPLDVNTNPRLFSTFHWSWRGVPHFGISFATRCEERAKNNPCSLSCRASCTGIYQTKGCVKAQQAASPCPAGSRMCTTAHSSGSPPETDEERKTEACEGRGDATFQRGQLVWRHGSGSLLLENQPWRSPMIGATSWSLPLVAVA